MRDEKRGEKVGEGEGERERGQPPLLPRVVNSERRRYLDQSNHAAGSAFYHYFTCFPFTSPSLDDIPRAISRDKKRKGTRSQKRTPCFLPASGVLRYPLGTSTLVQQTRLLQGGFLSHRTCGGLARCLSFARAKLNCGTCTRYYETLTASWFDFVPSKPEPKASS